MSIKQSLFASEQPLVGSSHRTLGEQLVGFSIYLTLSLSIGLLFPLASSFYDLLASMVLGLSMWSLWRVYSLKRLKVELSIFFAQFSLQVIWNMSNHVFAQELLALVSLLLLWSNMIMVTLLFWKKQKLSGVLLLYPIFWIFYLVGVNMIASIRGESF
ncbi:MAG: hypothetical protein A3D96_03565 [Chlamydiae bacterium RIFCSPHIGHO2_12_FULL_44_59]|nr:MAG: hypothetical protein A2796_02250 [Chlamydiae bacterium RIFCSPHIGHO2_01_FULL_44_39]OGN59841.1 MAG: hypothetical protein A3D96_03565 [Chlamydiae bacterium RIFCSPHIGHO2_12_FULL_44_59]OGN66048.1 MAG: hypothetical protein A2978_04080 [Chlamydiae bacterium RIFCSPLOWO2_01_FULL_44_52]OGN68584.1 MAG: hypothetical protein A3I67_02405 [Chlamydiae bacterium RIFCSPLOWO2_02_FULL_45_22]OGN69696.1 MAG: hypothetical protein A3F79_01280 [Chlamydiae bacterium RIFCSPLOWO2_12_FULL_45_20]